MSYFFCCANLALLLRVDGCASRVRIAPMLDMETLKFIDAARSRRQIEMSVRLVEPALDHLGIGAAPLRQSERKRGTMLRQR